MIASSVTCVWTRPRESVADGLIKHELGACLADEFIGGGELGKETGSDRLGVGSFRTRLLEAGA